MIDFFYTPWHLISASIALLLNFTFALMLSGYFKCTKQRALAICAWHILFTFVYAFYVSSNGGDALAYYNKSIELDVAFSFGTRGVVFFTSFLTQGLGLSLIGCFFVFQTFGFIGLLAFDAALRSVVIDKSKRVKLLATIIVFLPSVSFWSSAIGKDAISFMAVGLALWASLSLSKRMPLMIFAILLMLVVRPHMAGLMVMGLAASFMFQKSIPVVYRLFLGLSSLGVVAMLVPFALKYAGVGESVDTEQLGEYIDKRQSYNTEGGGGIDIASMSLPVQLFTYMFRPLPFEAHSIAALMASLDNMILLYLFVVGFYYLVTYKVPEEFKQHNRAFMWYYLIGSWLILAMTTANLGIAMRQKWMIAPMLIFLLISVIGDDKRSDIRE